MIPDGRGREYSESGVFFTTPRVVAITMNRSSPKASTGRSVVTRSPSSSVSNE